MLLQGPIRRAGLAGTVPPRDRFRTGSASSMTGASAGSIALGAVGAVIVLAALADLFVTVFNYDGFDFLASRMHRLLWKTMRALARPLPERARHTALSLGSASMLPATYILWLGLLICGFALIFHAGLRGQGFSSRAGHGIGTAFYLSAGDITSLIFGDILARSGLMRALVDLETIIGLTTFTLALGYVVTTFDVLKTLDSLHAVVRRHAEDPSRPSSILARHFRGGQPSELPSLLESLTDKLESYDQGLRRYPVVYYFHTRRVARSIPRVFSSLGRLVALLRWGLPADEPMSQDPLLIALITEYGTTLERLQRSFVGPQDLKPPEPLGREDFSRAYEAALGGGINHRDAHVDDFVVLQDTARASAGLDAHQREPAAPETYEQYCEWLPFDYRNRLVLRRIAEALGYEVV
jgi:hypothetical protein